MEGAAAQPATLDSVGTTILQCRCTPKWRIFQPVGRADRVIEYTRLGANFPFVDSEQLDGEAESPERKRSRGSVGAAIFPVPSPPSSP